MMNPFFLSVVLFCAAFTTQWCDAGKKWLIYERCELAEEGNLDGDSFSVKALTGYTYLFKLHGVDCPEVSNGAKSNFKDQVKYFSIEEKDLIEWGEKAAKFSKDFLSEPFTVYTQKVKAPGSGAKSRYYAIIVNAEGKRLDEALLEAGFGRVFGKGAEWEKPFWSRTKADLPRKMKEDRFLTKLRIIANKAKRENRGVWSAKSR